ncbi:hypothetical protein RND81_09G067900 [Saponaria officinalis]|uniref:Reverse transcriptase zinc-binding domain-containing protein n=1 Tax=Saponaria officinalis TaxID=3572 RepID=A0AAW1IJL7_SAPOF
MGNFKRGGLGFVRLHEWNVAALGKYVWWVQNKADHLWVRWVHAVYLKGTSWADYTPGVGTSWGWRKLCWVKNVVQANWMGSSNRYSTSEVYGKLVDRGSKGRLLSQDRLVRMGISDSNRCFLCGEVGESHDHLFFDCGFSQRCIQSIALWLGVIGLAMSSLLYRIWWARNTTRIESNVALPRRLCNDVRGDVITRVRVCNLRFDCSRGRQWFDDLCTRVCH